MSQIVYPVPQPSSLAGTGRIDFPLAADRAPNPLLARPVVQPDPVTVRAPQVVRITKADLPPPVLLWRVTQPDAITVRLPGLGFNPVPAELKPPRLLQKGTGQDLPLVSILPQWFQGTPPTVAPPAVPTQLLWTVVQPSPVAVRPPASLLGRADLQPTQLLWRVTQPAPVAVGTPASLAVTADLTPTQLLWTVTQPAPVTVRMPSALLVRADVVIPVAPLRLLVSGARQDLLPGGPLGPQVFTIPVPPLSVTPTGGTRVTPADLRRRQLLHVRTR